ncbi:MAG TPA: caspase family protein, partial [Kofleriaceae bacterium]|nr:caspase family protein [Kofleriaceae bacterium]
MTRASRLAMVAAAIAAGAALGPARAEAEVRRHALIVAHAGNAGGERAPLEYADDDGARYYELFAQLADDVRVYTVLDAASQQVHPAVAKIARVPRRADVLRGIDEAFARMRRDADAGHETVFYFVLVGHGTIGDGGEGTVALLDGSFSRTDLFQQVLARSPATTNHVIVDACNAYYLVHRRGDGTAPARRDAVAAFVAREELARYPNTGVLLSTSSAKDTHEWSAYRAGVFSHELRSAMAGGADVNGDGRIAYSEIAAFLAAANQHVTEQARVDVFARAPAADLARPLVDLRAARF